MPRSHAPGRCCFSSTRAKRPISTAYGPSDPAVCDKVFVTKGGKTSFQRDADLHGSGFIIDGQRIRGRVATCKLLRTKVDAPVVHMIASCATDVMLSNVQLTVRVLEPDKINRLFPGLEDMEMPFYRCPVGKGKP
jgi:hypothetical protein